MSEIPDNLYNPSTVDYDNETKPLDVIIQDMINSQLYDLHTWLPCQVIQVRSNQFVDIQPLLQRKMIDGTSVSIPVLQNVHVAMPRGTDYWLKLPVAVGDTGVALFCERSLDIWMLRGGVVDPADPRRHDLSDAIFIPGIYPKSGEVVGNATDMTLHNGTAEITLQKSGKFKIKNNSQELITVLSSLVDDLINALVITGIGPQPFAPATLTALNQIKTNLTTLKGT